MSPVDANLGLSYQNTIKSHDQLMRTRFHRRKEIRIGTPRFSTLSTVMHIRCFVGHQHLQCLMIWLFAASAKATSDLEGINAQSSPREGATCMILFSAYRDPIDLVHPIFVNYVCRNLGQVDHTTPKNCLGTFSANSWRSWVSSWPLTRLW